ncbi:hypothetical protein ACWEK5_41090 [Rhodococcus koreensis]
MTLLVAASGNAHPTTANHRKSATTGPRPRHAAPPRTLRRGEPKTLAASLTPTRITVTTTRATAPSA